MDFRLYEELIEGIPAELRVEDFVQGPSWTAVSSGGGAGAAMSQAEATRPPLVSSPARGMALRDLAAASVSWNLREASLGAAALNAFYNGWPRLEALSGLRLGPTEEADPFLRYGARLAGKRVAVVGHFVGVAERLREVCELSVLEREPREGDYPDEAAEYLIPGSDFVFITAATLVNKSLPRLLELSAGAFVVLVGPSSPCAASLFGQGVSVISSLAFRRAGDCLEAAAAGGHHRFVPSGVKVCLEAPIEAWT